MASETIRLKASLNEKGITEVKALIKHPMETGMRIEQSTGEFIPAHFIEEVVCEHQGKVVMSAIWSAGISKDPYIAFRFKDGKVGDKVKLKWKDNKNDTDEAEIDITQSEKSS